MIRTLLGLYAMSMNLMEEAERHLSAVVRLQQRPPAPLSTGGQAVATAGVNQDLRILSSLNLCIVYLRMGREAELSDLLSHMAPEKLASQSHSLKAAAFYVMGLNAFVKGRYPDAKRFLR